MRRTSKMSRSVVSLLASSLALVAAASSEASPPSTPAARIAQKQRYLLFDTIFHEQVNKQRRAFMFYLHLAMQLKRTLVLPRTRLLRRIPKSTQFDPTAEYVPWGDLFNVSALSLVHPILELEQFVALHGGVGLHVRISHQGCESREGVVSVPFNGLPDGLGAAKSICHNRLQYEQEKLSREYADEEAIAFSDSVDQLQMSQSLPLRPYVRYTAPVYDAATAFAATAFNGEPFISIHWRRTDFLAVRRSHEWALQSAADVVAHARAAMRASGVRHVYLATDSDDAKEVAAVTTALNAQSYPSWDSPNAPAPLLTKAMRANIEIATCALASRFLGTKTSSFTLAIMEERQAVYGHAATTGTEMGKPPPADGKDEL